MRVRPPPAPERRAARPGRAGAVGQDGRRRTPGGGGVSGRRLLGAHLPAVCPERRETVAGMCLGCRTPFAIDARLPLPARCPDCGGDVRAGEDVESRSLPTRPPFNPMRLRREKR